MIDPLAPDFGNTPVNQARPVHDYRPDDPQQAPCVTVVTPFHNARAIFHETADSLFRQSLQQWEWLIVNDASTSPEAIELLEQYRRRDPRIRVIDHAANVGLSAARNTGFRQARGEYVFLLDDDDLLEPTTLEKSYWFLESHPEFSFVDAWSVGFGVVEYLWSEGFRRGELFLSENVATSMTLVRKRVHESVGGFDEAIRGGMEDWDFWLRCADAGCWGATIPEYFGWYRRRSDHGDRWTGLAGEQRRQEFRTQLQQRYPRLYEGGFPKIATMPREPFTSPREQLPCENRLHKSKPRLLMILPWLTMGGADKFNLDLLEQLTRRGWQVTIATTEHGDNSWLPRAAAHTPDIFVLSNFLKPADQPLFLRYLIDSRRIDCVLISATELGYMLLPYLRAHCPQPVYIDYSHMEDETWRNGGYPRFAVGAQSQLDLNIVASEHLKRWMIQRGGEAQRIEVAYINIDPDVWKPHPELRAELRYRFGWPADRPVILYAGRLCRQKQPHVFGQVMRVLAERGTGFGALAAGDGPERDWLQGFIDEHGLDAHVHLLGPQSPEQMRKLMAAADIFFLPSRWEGIALTIYEAMASGLAVVGADVGGQRELVTPALGRKVFVASGRRADPDSALRG